LLTGSIARASAIPALEHVVYLWAATLRPTLGRNLTDTMLFDSELTGQSTIHRFRKITWTLNS
jgi:hypothetical protein